MAFILKEVLKALLFSSSQPLSTKEIQEIFARFHEQGALIAGAGPDAPALTGESAATTPGEPPPGGTDLGAQDAPGIPALGAPEDAWSNDVPALVTTAQIREALDELARELRTADGVFLLVEGASGFRLVTHPRFARWVRILRNEPSPVRLSQSAMETLAVVAYRQPVTRAEIEHIRGVSAEAGVSKLLERELIQVIGRADLPGRPIQYGTTDAFLEFVGVRSLDELPASDVLSRRQIDEWLRNATQSRHPSDRDMGLSEEGEEQLSLDDAARAASARQDSSEAASAPSPTELPGAAERPAAAPDAAPSVTAPPP
jgi:segregation and condensation protein B